MIERRPFGRTGHASTVTLFGAAALALGAAPWALGLSVAEVTASADGSPHALDPPSEGLDLAGDRVALDLTVGRDAGVDGRPGYIVVH